MKRALFVANMVLLCVAPVRAQSGMLWRPEDRVLITDFSNVLGIARDNTTLYGVTPYGLLSYDIIAHRFKQPLTIEDGYPVRERVLSAAFAPSEFKLLIGTAQGVVYAVNTLSSRFDDVAHVGGPVVQLIAPRDGFDIYAGTPQSWFRLRGGSFFPEAVQGPPRAPPVGADDPFLRSMLAIAGAAPGRFTAEVVALEHGISEGSYFAATRGNGIMQLDSRSLAHTRLPYGLNTRGAGVVAVWRNRVYFGGDARVATGPLVSATSELDDFRDYSPGSGAPEDVITAILATDSALWVGTANGLFALRGRVGAEKWESYARAVSDAVNALAESGPAVYAATDRGVTRIENGVTESVLTGRIVYGLAPVRDTLWIACDVGLAALPLRTAGAQVVVLRGGGSPEMPVFDVRVAGDSLYAVARDALYRRGPGGWVQPDRTVAARLGPLGRLRSFDGAIWLLGTLGFAMKGAQSGVWAYYMASDDIPEAPVRDLLPLGNTLWLATPAGALRVPKPR